MNKPKQPGAAEIQNEEHLLDLIHAALRERPAGWTTRDMARVLRVAPAALTAILRKSESVIRFDPKKKKWIADWSECEKSFRPKWASAKAKSK